LAGAESVETTLDHQVQKWLDRTYLSGGATTGVFSLTISGLS
jgi:hypothetical protein